jgi:hypothetical protein
MKHSSRCSRSREDSTVHQTPRAQRWLLLRHRDADRFLSRLQLHVLTASLTLVGRRDERRQLIDQLARGIVLLLLGRCQLQHPQSLRRRIRHLPVVTLPPTATTPSAAPRKKEGEMSAKRSKGGRYLQRRCGGGRAEFRAPLVERQVELLLEDGGVGGAGVLARRLEAGEHLLEIIDAGLGARAELVVPPSRPRRRPLPHRRCRRRSVAAEREEWLGSRSVFPFFPWLATVLCCASEMLGAVFWLPLCWVEVVCGLGKSDGRRKKEPGKRRAQHAD